MLQKGASSTHVVVDVKYPVRDPSVLRLGRVEEVRDEPTVLVVVQGDVLQYGILANRLVYVRLRLLAQVYSLGVAPPLEVEDAVLVPPMLVVTNQRAVRVGGEGRLDSGGTGGGSDLARKERRGRKSNAAHVHHLAGPGQSKEEGGVALLADVCRAVHGELGQALHGKPVVHE